MRKAFPKPKSHRVAPQTHSFGCFLTPPPFFLFIPLQKNGRLAVRAEGVWWALVTQLHCIWNRVQRVLPPKKRWQSACTPPKDSSMSNSFPLISRDYRLLRIMHFSPGIHSCVQSPHTEPNPVRPIRHITHA